MLLLVAFKELSDVSTKTIFEREFRLSAIVPLSSSVNRSESQGICISFSDPFLRDEESCDCEGTTEVGGANN